MPAPMRFSAKPSFIIRSSGIFSLPKITALGAVATGNMNAQLALIAAGIISSNGSIWADIAVAASIGMSSVVVAVLDVISVKKVIQSASAKMTSMIGSVVNVDKASPMTCDNPVTVKALAIAIPPANNINTPQGI